jgi:hypothetical protein
VVVLLMPLSLAVEDCKFDNGSGGGGSDDLVAAAAAAVAAVADRDGING